MNKHIFQNHSLRELFMFIKTYWIYFTFVSESLPVQDTMSATENAQLESVVKVDVEAVMEEEMALIEEDQLVTEAEEAVMEGEAGDTKFERVEFYKKNGGARAVDKEEHIYKQYNSKTKIGVKYFACTR